MIEELFFGLTAVKEIIAEPDLSKMCLVLICSVYLLDCVEYLGLEVKSFPNLRKSSPSQLLSSEVPLDKGFVLQDRLVVSSFEDRFLLRIRIGCANWRRLLICLSFIPNFPFVRFRLAFA